MISENDDDKIPDQKVQIQKLKERAVRLLARRDHSVHELKNKLKQRRKPGDISASEDVLNVVIDALKDLGLMACEDDLSSRWAKQWRNEGRGRHWISGKLKSKGLPPLALRDDDEEFEAARHFILKRLRSKEIHSLSFQEKTRLSRSLVSRGFSHSVIASVIKGQTTYESR